MGRRSASGSQAETSGRSRRWAWLAFLLGARLPRRAVAATAGENCSQPTAVIFLHGSGDTGNGLRKYMETVGGKKFLQELKDKGVKTYWPDSGQRPYTLAGGLVMPVWYDRSGLPPTAPEDTASVEESVSSLYQLIEQVKADGVPPERIIIGGFSMGGGIALQLALRHMSDIGGVFVLSSFLCDDAAVYSSLRYRSSLSILMLHGEADGFIKSAWGKATADRLRGLGLNVEYTGLKRTRHEINRKVVMLLRDWLWRVLKFD